MEKQGRFFLKEINQILIEANATNEEIELRTDGELLEVFITSKPRF